MSQNDEADWAARGVPVREMGDDDAAPILFYQGTPEDLARLQNNAIPPPGTGVRRPDKLN